MGVGKFFKDLFGSRTDEYDDYDDDRSQDEYYEEEEEEDTAYRQRGRASASGSGTADTGRKIVPLHTGMPSNIKIVEPAIYEDCLPAAEEIKARRLVIINVQNLDKEQAQRVVDFLSGAAYAVDGDLSSVTSGIYIAAPNYITIENKKRSGQYSARRSGTAR